MTAVPGWYQDPWDPNSVRWWDGSEWTGHSAVPAQQPVHQREPAATFPAAAAPAALIGIAVTVVLARATASLVLDRLDSSPELFLLAFYAVVFSGLWLTCSAVSRRYGTGKPGRDFGLSWRPTDILRAIAVFFLAGIAQTIALSPWANHLSRVKRLTEGLAHVSLPALAVFAVAAMVGAPILEELAFRGMLQRSLAARFGHAWSIIGQGMLFGLYHLTPGLGGANVPYVTALAAVGAVFGWAAWRWRRLGPGGTAHLFVNVLGVLTLFASR